MMDALSCYVLPGTSFLMSLGWDLNLGFKILTVLPVAVLYTRIREKTLDPDVKETFLREMIYTNEEISKYFNDDTTHVLDYDLEYDAGFPCSEKFPEFNNKMFSNFLMRFFVKTKNRIFQFRYFNDNWPFCLWRC